MKFNIFGVRFFFNSYIYYLTRSFIASTLAFNLSTRAFSLLTRGFELVTRGFKLVTRGFELVTRQFERVTCDSCFTFSLSNSSKFYDIWRLFL